MLKHAMLKLATEADLPAICMLGMEVNLLHHEAWPTIFASIADPVRDLDYWRTCLIEEDTRVVIAELDGRAVGMITAKITDENSTLVYPHRFCRIGSISVTESARGQGIGRALMQAIEAWAQSEGATDLRLSVWEFNRRAISFYEELGYTTRSRLMFKPITVGAVYGG